MTPLSPLLRRSAAHLALPASLLVLIVAGCSWVELPAGLSFPCEVVGDCPSPYVACSEGVCALPVAGAGADASVGEASDGGVPLDGGEPLPLVDGGAAALDGGEPLPLADGGTSALDGGGPPPVTGPTVGGSTSPVPISGTVPVAPPRSEAACDDSRDDDGDTLSDCADPDCAGRACGAAASARCCDGRCVETTRDVDHCGGCGARCSPGRICMTVPAAGGFTGACSCLGGGCPLGQRCGLNGVCGCSGDDACALGQRCTSTPLAGACVAR